MYIIADPANFVPSDKRNEINRFNNSRHFYVYIYETNIYMHIHIHTIYTQYIYIYTIYICLIYVRQIFIFCEKTMACEFEEKLKLFKCCRIRLNNHAVYEEILW